MRDFTPLVNLPVSTVSSLLSSSLSLSRSARVHVPLLASSVSHAPAINRLQITGLTALNFSRPPSRSRVLLDRVAMRSEVPEAVNELSSEW